MLFCHELARRLAGAAPRGAPAEAAAAAAAAPGAASCTLPGARRLRVVAMNPGLMLDSNFTAGVVGPFLGSTAGAAIGAIAWGLSPLLRFVPAVGKLLRSAQQSGPILAAIALPAAPGPADDNAAYYDGAEVKPASAFSRSAACAAGHQQELFRRTLAWAQLSDAELADAGFPLAARRE